MKTLLLLLSIPFFGISQNDTIYKKDGKIIACTITLDNGNYLFYKDKKGNGTDIDKQLISFYKQNNEVKNVSNAQQSLVMNKPIDNFSDSVKVTDELVYLKKCMADYHRQHSIGTIILGVGTGLGIATLIMDVSSNEKNALLISSGVVAVVGSVIMIDASKFFKRASLGVNGNGLTVKYIFK